MKDKRVYRKVYFRIEAGYVWGKGMDDAAYEAFHDELKTIFPALGFTEKPKTIQAASPDYVRESENLYCHPQSFSGYLIEGNIPVVETAIKHAKTFKWRKTDLYETAYNFTEAELLVALNKKKTEIETAVLNAFRTKRRNLYRPASGLYDIKSKIPFFATAQNEAIERQFISGVFEELLKSKRIVKSTGKWCEIYRTAV